jgi:SAM-dependent methyltransferase
MIQALRQAEHAKYQRAYSVPRYAMGGPRMDDAIADLKAIPIRGSYLDVGCGRGEMLRHAAAMGFSPVFGAEIVPELCDGVRVIRSEAHALPFADHSFDVVTLFDVIEHLIPGDDELVCRELSRVAAHHILLSANNRESRNVVGDVLHINRREYAEWDFLFRLWFPGHVTWIKGSHQYVSETWRVDL